MVSACAGRRGRGGAGFDRKGRRHEAWIGFVHTRDLWNEGYPWAELFALLAESGYEGFALIEGKPTANPVEDMKRQRALWEQFQPA